MIRKIFKFRLRTRKNPDYLEWFREVTGKEPHHILESFESLKCNDLLLAPKSRQAHDKIHRNGQTEDEFIEDLLVSLEKVFDYIEHLQKVIKKRK